MAVSATALLAVASPASAKSEFRCNGVFKGKTYKSVVVPQGASCTLIGSTVKRNVRVLRNAYFQSTGTKVRGDIEGKAAQTVFVDTGSRVSGSVESVDTRQFYVFNSTIGEDIEPERTREAVQVCGNKVRKGNIEVLWSGPNGGALNLHPGTDILIGDPLTVGCRGNSVERGDIRVIGNYADIEFVIRGNTVKKGALEVARNTGPAPKVVASNVGGRRLACRDNSVFATNGNKGWDRRSGQCS
jgi:hypothetical protein